MPESKKRKHSRRHEKIYQMVEFESEIFDGKFVFPKATHMNQKVATALDEGRFNVHDWLREAGVDEESIEILPELDAEETQQFMKEWSNGDIISVPK